MNELVPELDPTAFSEIIAALQPWVFTAYPEVHQLYELLAQSLKTTVDHVVVTNGSDAGIKQTLDVFCDPGDPIVILHPTYGMYEVYAHILNLDTTLITHAPDFTMDTNRVLDSITTSTKVVAIANPNGAIGSVMAGADIRRIMNHASERGAVVLLDEAYVHYYRDEWSSLIDEFDNLVIARTMSKAGGIAGLRLGYLLTNPTVRECLMKVRPNVEINSIAVFAGIYLIQHPQILSSAVQATLAGKAYLVKHLADMGFEVYPGHANFVQVRFGRFHRLVRSALKRANILVRDQSAIDMLRDFTRITAGPEIHMARVVDVIHAAIANDLVVAG